MSIFKPKAHEFRWINDKCRQCFLHKDGRCTVYVFPDAQWRNGRTCPMATHVLTQVDQNQQGRFRVGQQKQFHKKGRR